jgi:hypothetical protein
MSELRITDTNSANDSKGRAFGLEGNDYLYIVIGFVAALGLYLILNVLLRINLGIALLLALPLWLGPSGWVLLLRHNKPAGYSEDWWDHQINREGWSFAPFSQPAKPGKEHHA